MMKRTILGVLMLIVGFVTATTPEGLLIGLPLLGLGVYFSFPRQLSGYVPSRLILSTR